MKRSLINILALAILSVSAFAVPNQITYSGRLLQNGALVNSTLQMDFSISNLATGGTVLWSTTNVNVDVNQGIYSVLLGDTVNPVNPNVFSADNAYLQVTVGGEVLLPRTKINSVGYALQAGGLTTSGGGVAVFVSANGNVGLGTTDTNTYRGNLSVYTSGGNTMSLLKDNKTPALGFGDAANISGLFEGGSAGFSFYTASGTWSSPVLTRQMVIKNTGNVGIATASPAAQLHIVGVTDNAVFYVQASSSNAGLANSVNVGLYVDKRGSVGVGTTAPGAHLTVTGVQSEQALFVNLGTGAANFGVDAQAQGAGVENYAGYFAARNAATNVAILVPNGYPAAGINNYQLYLASDAKSYFGGNVGIGTTAPRTKLEVAGTTDPMLYVSDGGGASAKEVFIRYLTATDVGEIGVYQEPTTPKNLVLQRLGGNVGIGATNPTKELTVMTSSTAGGISLHNSTGSEIGRWYNNGNANATEGRLYMSSAGVANVDIRAGGDSYFNGGNVGVGTTSPGTTRLSVVNTGTSGPFVLSLDNDQVGNTSGLLLSIKTAGVARGFIGAGKKIGGSGTVFSDEIANSLGIRSESALHLGSNGNNIRMTIDTAGYVGIGTTNPTNALTLASGKIGLPNQASGDWVYFPNFNQSYYFTAGTDEFIARSDVETGAFRFKTPSKEMLYLKVSSGFVGIGTTNPGYTLQVNGNLYANTYVNLPSDIRLKGDVKTIANALDKLTKLRGVNYMWLAPEKRSIGKDMVLPLNKLQAGFIAQEVEPIIPEAVGTDK
ncbi:MAG: tail fiber domain-containing protein, partial [Candidatus Margulisiibacteriota bacterium]